MINATFTQMESIQAGFAAPVQMDATGTITMGGSTVAIRYFDTKSSFPAVGQEGLLYVAKDEWAAYLWDKDNQEYREIGLSEELYEKLESIEWGAQVNTVTGVKGDAEEEYRIGDINITKADIGLSEVDNTADMDKPVSTATQEAIDNATKTYIHTQMVASDVWEINHNLNKFPSIDVIDSGGTMVVGECEYIDSNNVRVTFIGAFSGKAYLN